MGGLDPELAPARVGIRCQFNLLDDWNGSHDSHRDLHVARSWSISEVVRVKECVASCSSRPPPIIVRRGPWDYSIHSDTLRHAWSPPAYFSFSTYQSVNHYRWRRQRSTESLWKQCYFDRDCRRGVVFL